MRQLLLFLLCFTVLSGNAQNLRLPGSENAPPSLDNSGRRVDLTKEQQLKRDIDNQALAVANQLMRCCSSYGGNNVQGVVDYDNVYVSDATGEFVISMIAKWTGSLTGNPYWIQGKLVVSKNGSASWLKIRDSGGFQPACSQNCIN